MSRYVSIATVGAAPIRLDERLTSDAALREVKRYLRTELDQVLPDRPDLVVLPETCSTPYNFSPPRRKEFHRENGAALLEFVSGVATQYDCNVAYASHVEDDQGAWRNRLMIFDRSGTVVGHYDKNFPFPDEISNEGLERGTAAPIIRTDFGTIGCAICFDLNYDELRMKYVEASPDIVVFSSMFHGGFLQNFWAYTCRSHFVAAVSNLAPSSILSPVGMELATSTNYVDYAVVAVNLDCAVLHLDYHAEKLKAAKQKYGRSIRIVDPGRIGSVLLSVETDAFDVTALLDEFDLEPVRTYLLRAGSIGVATSEAVRHS